MRTFCLFFTSSFVLLVSSFAAESRPNILFAIADDWGPHASAYGTPWVKTPAFDRVAKDGLLFKQAYTPNAKCAPSRACILTGRNSWQLKEAANHICYFPPEFKGWGEALAEKGWNVGHTTKGWGPGSAKDVNGKPREMTGKAWNKKKLQPPTEEISNCDYAANFTDFLDAAPADKPWCFWYGAIEPHRGYEFGSGVKKGGKKLSDIDHVPAYWPDNEVIRNDMLDYAFEVEHFDTQLGRMLAELEKRGQLDNTLVVVTADHGMPFPRSKGNANVQANHVPFAVMWKKGITAPGRVIEDFVSFIDLAPTFVEVAGLKWSDTGMAESPGRSLTDLFANAPKHTRDHVLLGKERTDIGRPNDWGYPIRALVTKDNVLIENFEPSRWPGGNPETGYMDCDAGATKTFIIDAHRKNPNDPFWQLCFGLRPGLEFYDLKSDPDFVKNQPADPRVAALKEQLHAELKAQGDPRMDGKGDIFDKYEHASKANVGFYEKFMRGEPLKANWINQTDIEPRPVLP
ncbi:MAG: sulfatase [Verrucomicrobiaceae bacterium]